VRREEGVTGRPDTVAIAASAYFADGHREHAAALVSAPPSGPRPVTALWDVDRLLDAEHRHVEFGGALVALVAPSPERAASAGPARRH
jgi:hypothetical protein